MGAAGRCVARASGALLVVGMTVSAGRAQIAPASVAPSGSSLPTNGVGSQFELVFWQSVAATEDRAQIEAYLQQFPNGTFSALARAKIGAIERREAMARGAPPPPAAPAISPAPAPFAPPAAASLPVPTPAAATAAPAVPAPAAAPPSGAAAAATQPAVAPTATGDAATALSAMTAQLGALGRSQGQEPAAMPAPANAPAAQLLPARPKLVATASVALPDHFCTAMDRNNYYDAVYKPAKDQVDENNRNAIAYLDRLKAVYDGLGARNDTAAMNQVARESQDYQPIAGEAYRTSVAYEGMFAKLMAVPVGKCP